MKEKRPTLVFLIETKLRRNKIELIRCKLRYTGLFAVDCIGRSGGLALLWGEDFSVEIQNYSQHHINRVIQAHPSSVPWKFTGFYGHPDVAK